MSRLSLIANTAQQVAEAISAVLDVETEILDDEYTIIAGTGKYKMLRGTKDEEAYAEGTFLYSKVFQTGETYIVEDPDDEIYGPKLIGELGEICCPIKSGDQVIGVVSLVAFDSEQHRSLLKHKEQLSHFLMNMAFLMASRVAEVEAYHQLSLTSNRLEALLQSIPFGIIAVDAQKRITHSNRAALNLFKTTPVELLGSNLEAFWPNSSLFQVLQSGRGFTNKEEFLDTGGLTLHLAISANPVIVDKKVEGAIAYLENMANARQQAYELTETQLQFDFNIIKGSSEKINRARELAARVSRSNSTVLITGESGTGKELFARAIQYTSQRREKPLVIVNCGAIPETLLESELFGYEDGAFTGARKGGRAGKFELADGGTIFLDEIGDLPLHLQVKLLHVLQRRQLERIGGNKIIPINVRVIAATNKDLEAMCATGEFREDLYYRLSVIPIHVPPLRERLEDIEILMQHFLEKYCQILEKTITLFSDEVKTAFHSYYWPGNIRELENAVEYAVNLESGKQIELESIPVKIIRFFQKNHVSGSLLKYRINTHEEEIINEFAEKIHRGELSKEAAARKLGVSRATLYRKLRKMKNNTD